MKISNVFDIKKFAVHDGSGIRTTVFFKGCPLRCQWCQNPEGLLKEPQLLYFENKCIHCEICKNDPHITFKNKPLFEQGYDYHNVVRQCPSTALQYDSTPYTVEELLSVVLEDKVFYRDNGGVTVSGGEPLLHSDFLFLFLKECKNRNIHTAIETSFYYPWDKIEPLLDDLDLIYIDLKIFDNEQHLQSTGVSNSLILENIRRTLTSKHKEKVIIRTPLIPEYTAYKENIRSISKYISDIYKDVRYELLNYNPLASAKYDLTSFTYGVSPEYKMYTKKEMKEFQDIAKTYIHNFIE